MTSAPSWVAPLREAAYGKPRAAVEVVRGVAPGWLAGDAVHAITSLLLAALVSSAAFLRSELQSTPLDLIALLLRTASVAFGVRAAIAVALWCARLRRDARASEHVLAWSSEGLFWRAGSAERWLARADVIDVVVPEERSVRGAASSLQPVLIVTRPVQPLACWTLPPYFAVHAEVLAARLARFRRLGGKRELAATPPPSAPEERYVRAARGLLEAGEVPVPEGFGYRYRAPYGVLLALVFVADAVRSAGALRERVLPAALLSALLALTALWIWFRWLRGRRQARLGMALLLTPEELLIRGKQGVVSIPWTQLAGAEVLTRLAWSPLVGSYLVRTLWFSTLEGTSMPFDGGFLGVAPEVLASLANGYRTGSFDTAAPASTPQGSGGGGGISGTDGTTTSPVTSTSPSRAKENRAALLALERTNES
ncbi:MAG: hypothetical protein JWN04_18 [Myxococcaceae bacterium]|nr:hypothetical protein [Myxococcaceae bacterium]